MVHFHGSGHFSHAFTDQSSDEHLWDPLDRSLKFSLCAALLSQHSRMNSATLFSLNYWICLLYSGSLPSSTWIFSCSVTWKLPQDGKLRQFRAHLIIFFPLSQVTILHCLKSNILKSIVSFILSSYLFLLGG